MATGVSDFCASAEKEGSEMSKIKGWAVSGWNLFLEGLDYVSGLIHKYPKTALALFVAYVMVRQ
jgi:hypothetical protein